MEYQHTCFHRPPHSLGVVLIKPRLQWLVDTNESQMVTNLPAKRETQVQPLGGEDPLEKEMAAHSSILASQVVKNLLGNAGDVRDSGSIPGSRRSPEGGQGNPLQYSCLGNPMDSGAWLATVHGVPKESNTT